MVEYFYKFDYTYELGDIVELIDPDFALDNLTSVDSLRTPYTPLRSQLQGHAEMYVLADKYDIPGIKELAKDKFEREAMRLVFSPHVKLNMLHFLTVIPYVYMNTAPNDDGLRPSIVKTWRMQPHQITTTLGDARLRKLIEKFPDLGMDLIKGLITTCDVERRFAAFENAGYGRQRDGGLWA